MPLRVPEGSRRSELLDKASELLVHATRLELGLPKVFRQDLRLLTAVVNTYSSNLIEGHDTQPREILRAMQTSDLPEDAKRRELVVAARASATMQLLLDAEAERGALKGPLDVALLESIHLSLFKEEPALLTVAGATPYCALPGKTRGESMDVQVGHHVPPLGRDVDRLLSSVVDYYGSFPGGPASMVLDAAAMHHRLLYLHPFSEGNGRAIRLFTHAQMQLAGAAGGGLWSISRGLARGRTGYPDARGEYKSMLAQADKDRQGDSTDGRGALSQLGLEGFVDWFLDVALDQVTYMATLYSFQDIASRLETLAAAEFDGKALQQALPILRRLLDGELSRREAWSLTGQSERTGRAVVKVLLDKDLVRSPSERGPLRLELMRSELFPGLL